MGTPRLASPDVLPPDTTRLGELVAFGFGWPGETERPDELVLWHFCSHRGWGATEERMVELYGAVAFWVPATVGAHDLISTEPLHLEPSVYWPSCCGLHGFVRDGQWIGV